MKIHRKLIYEAVGLKAMSFAACVWVNWFQPNDSNFSERISPHLIFLWQCRLKKFSFNLTDAGPNEEEDFSGRKMGKGTVSIHYVDFCWKIARKFRPSGKNVANKKRVHIFLFPLFFISLLKHRRRMLRHATKKASQSLLNSLDII